MISHDTALEIHKCYREIAVAEKLIKDMQETLEERRNNREGDKDHLLRDPFGNEQMLQIGAPTGRDTLRCFNVRSSLGVAVLRAHIADQQALLVQANEKARIELDSTIGENIRG
jgi:hypothetical protein